ncbi:hypothetical protein GCM10020331_085770 [Ectobacillus funiculus]
MLLLAIKPRKIEKKDACAHELANDDTQLLDDDEKKDKMDETFSTWHRENKKNNDNENFFYASS